MATTILFLRGRGKFACLLLGLQVAVIVLLLLGKCPGTSAAPSNPISWRELHRQPYRNYRNPFETLDWTSPKRRDESTPNWDEPPENSDWSKNDLSASQEEIRGPMSKRNPECIMRCVIQGQLHPAMCHSLC